MAADSMQKASTHQRIGSQPLWKTPGLQLPAYIQHVAKELMKQGKDESTAIRMAVGIIKRWAAGSPSGGEKSIQQTTVAAARKALAEWEAAKSKAHAYKGGGGGKKVNASNMLIHRQIINLAGSWNEAAHPRVAAGQVGGGRFTSSSGGGSSSSSSSSKTGAKAGAKAGAAGGQQQTAGQALFNKMENMTPAQRAAFLKTLTNAQLTQLGQSAMATKAGGQDQAAAQALIATELSNRGIKLGDAEKSTASKSKSGGSSKSSGGSKKSGGSSKSGGGSSGGGSSKSKSSGSKKSSSGSSKKSSSSGSKSSSGSSTKKPDPKPTTPAPPSKPTGPPSSTTTSTSPPTSSTTPTPAQKRRRRRINATRSENSVGVINLARSSGAQAIVAHAGKGDKASVAAHLKNCPDCKAKLSGVKKKKKGVPNATKGSGGGGGGSSSADGPRVVKRG